MKAPKSSLHGGLTGTAPKPPGMAAGDPKKPSLSVNVPDRPMKVAPQPRMIGGRTA